MFTAYSTSRVLIEQTDRTRAAPGRLSLAVCNVCFLKPATERHTYLRRLHQDADKQLDSSADLGAAGADQDPAIAKANSVKCAKEKNRQAQRRFRERQKGLIQALKERADTLQKQVRALPCSNGLQLKASKGYKVL